MINSHILDDLLNRAVSCLHSISVIISKILNRIFSITSLPETVIIPLWISRCYVNDLNFCDVLIFVICICITVDLTSSAQSIEMKMLSFSWNLCYWLHLKLLFWQLSGQLLMKIPSKWQQFNVNIRRESMTVKLGFTTQPVSYVPASLIDFVLDFWLDHSSTC